MSAGKPCGPAASGHAGLEVEGAEGGREVPACVHQQTASSASPCSAEPAGIHEEQRGVSGSHRSDSNIWLLVELNGSNWPYLSTCLIHMNGIRVISLFSLYPADVLFRRCQYSSTNIK